jgi:hypothetical protein
MSRWTGRSREPEKPEREQIQDRINLLRAQSSNMYDRAEDYERRAVELEKLLKGQK